jgi:hypothetical protein
MVTISSTKDTQVSGKINAGMMYHSNNLSVGQSDHMV